jgi:shikimate dehydrogenase
MENHPIAPRIKGTTSLIGIIGHPLKHTLSPLLHNYALDYLNLDMCYVPFDIEPECLETALAGLKALGVKGVNVTIPYKEAIVPLLDRVSDDAETLGAVNTVHFDAQSTCGHNTDAMGFLASWDQDIGIPIEGTSALILGAGGSARAIYYALASRKVQSITLCSRSREKSSALHRHFNSLFPGIERASAAFSDEIIFKQGIEKSQIIINCTPLGMMPHLNDSPMPFMEALRKDAIVYDLIYNPSESRFLRECRSRGIRCSGGFGMLLHQAALSFKIWTGQGFPMGPIMRYIQENLDK